MEDCAAILAETAKAAGCLQLAMEGPHRRSLTPRPSGSRSRRRFQRLRRHRSAGDAAGDGRAGSRRARRGGARGRHPDRRRRHLVRHFQPRAGRAHRAAARHRRRRRCSTNIRCPKPRWRGRPPIRGWRERFELYACGVELANGFGELTDRGRAAPPLRSGDGREAAPLRRALSDRCRISSRRSRQMPPASGIALGFDRLVMLATGAPRIEQVLWAPVAGDDR